MQRHIPAHRLAQVIGPALHASDGKVTERRTRGRTDGPAYERLAHALRQAIADGRLAEGSRLPSERELTEPIGLSRTTVTRAYAALREQGYLVTRRGSGSIVRVPKVPGGRVDHLLSPSSLDRSGADLIDLTCTAQGAPWQLTEAYRTAVDEVGAYLGGTGYYPSGLPVLRAKIAARFEARGLRTDPEQILITAGALAGVAIAGGALVKPGEAVLIESPTYPNVIATLQGTGARLIAHPIDHLKGDWEVSALTANLRQSRARVAYLIPDFHNPTGALMSEDQRTAVAAALRAAGTTAIIDESIVDLGLDIDEMPSPLARYLPEAITVGSASKTIWGGLRIGWLRAPRSKIDGFAASRLRLDLGAPVVEQLVTAQLLDDYEAILTERRAQLRAGRQVLLAGLAEHLPQWQVRVPSGGMALWCALPQQGSTLLAAAAPRHGVQLAAGPNFAPAGGLDGWLRLPYALAPERLAQVPKRLAAAWDDVVHHRVASPRRGHDQRRIIA